MAVRKEKIEALHRRMELLKIKKEDCLEKFVLGSGKGGQKVQKTASCVYLKHLPSKIEVKCSKDRQREVNRYLARVELCDRLEEISSTEPTKRSLSIEKKRKQKARRKRRTKNKLLEDLS